MKLCINCKFYRAGGAKIEDDTCRHEKAIEKEIRLTYSGVREELEPLLQYYACGPMRVGICGPDASLFEEAT